MIIQLIPRRLLRVHALLAVFEHHTALDRLAMLGRPDLAQFLEAMEPVSITRK